MDQSVVFTLLPRDVTQPGGDLRGAVFVSPRLTPDGPDSTAADFPAFVDWPAVVADAQVRVERSGGPTGHATVETGALASDLWTTYIAPLPVRGWTYHDLSSTDLRSYPAQAIHALARGLYTAVAAASGGGHPDPLAGGLRNLGAAYAELGADSLPARDKKVDGQLRARQRRRFGQEHGNRQFEPGGMAPRVTPLTPEQAVAQAGDAALDLAEARRFYDRPEARDPDAAKYPRPDPDYVPPKLEKADPDFHDILGALGDHPELLTALGLVIPITLPSDVAESGGDLRVTMEHPLLEGNSITVQPWTRTTVDGDVFEPVSETGDIRGGRLLLDDSDRYEVAQVDLDSAALLIEQRVANVYPIARAAGSGEPVTGDLPALRSTGLTVTRLRRAMILFDRIGRSKDNAEAIAAGNEVVLFAEDLVRGFRIDVDSGAGWHSLMHRRVAYVDREAREEVFSVPDQEAYVKASSLTSVPGASVDRHYLHEALFGWDGWSLALPRPGKHIRGTEDEPGALAAEGEPFPGPLALETRYELLSGTLPRLRYGSTYRFRARSVDLAGQSTKLLADDPATPPRVFGRFQPVLHPTTVPRYAFTEGESTLRLVIRSGVEADNGDPTGPVETVAPATYSAALTAETPRTFAVFRAECERHFAPPKTSQQEAELLGAFDDSIGLQNGSPVIYRAAFARARREQGTLADREIFDAADPAASTAVSGIHLVPPLSRDGEFDQATLDSILASLKRGQAPDAGFVIVHDTDELAVPYLPDPLAAGIALRFQGAGTAREWEHMELLPYAGAWPDLSTYRIVLENGAPPGVSVTGSEIRVQLPPGATALVRATSTLSDQSVLKKLGLWDWIESTVPAASISDVVAGAHQMITPEEVLTLVHATQRPLVRPWFEPRLRAQRGYGETFTHLAGVLRFQSASTGRFDVDGTWAEWFDDPASGQPPELVPGQKAHAFDVSVADGADEIALEAGLLGDLRHELGDHRHRKIRYTPTATTRFSEYLPPAVRVNVSNLQVVGRSRTCHVPNSTRPPAPVVHSVIPTFTWTDEPPDPLDPVTRARSRSGGFRVWLERPWYRSGEDELLGVVLSGADAIVAVEDLRRQYVSLWGKDPIRMNGELAAAVPRPRDFSGDGLLEMDRLTLVETGNRHPGVTVVGHPVRYSVGRDKWYADLIVDPGESYWPFLRLALARFQPWSVTDAHLSPVVVVDFVQLTNRRTAAVTRPDAETVRVSVSGIEERRPTAGLFAPPTGRVVGAFRDAFVSAPPNRGVRAWVERRGATTSDLDWQRVGRVAELPRIDEDEVMRVWSGNLELAVPLPVRRPGTEPDDDESDWRVVLTEWESLPFDDATGASGGVERIVYLDHFPL